MIKIGAIQASSILDDEDIQKINEKQVDEILISKLKRNNLEKYEHLINQAAEQGVQILGLPELFAGPFFAAVANDPAWKLFAEPDEGPTVQKMQQLAARHKMVIIVPFYEVDNNQYFNTCVVIDANGDYLGKYRKMHIPQGDGFNEQDYFDVGNLGLPVFETKYAKVGVYICFDRHFVDGFRTLKKRGAEIIIVPSATVAATSEYIWEPEARMRAFDNKVYVIAINRVGEEKIGGLKDTHFYGSTMIIDPKGRIITKGSRTEDEIVAAEVEFVETITEATERYPLADHILSPFGYDIEPKGVEKRVYSNGTPDQSVQSSDGE
jgi:beta-ureidopropionase